jgi:tRNA A-37 threonylcarbamoyl transferase component Bud32
VPDPDSVSQAQRRVGTVLRGKYHLDRVLGIGGMAVVYAATHRNTKRFAVKMLHPELSIHEDVRTRFLREGYVANSVQHPGAVAVLDDDIAEDGAAFLVMELLDGAATDQLWEKRDKRLSVRVVLAVGDQLLDVLAAAHARTIVHRDIKPANIFLTRDGTLKVLDFGIARLRDATSERLTRTGMMMGTPAFMAPEQALGQSSHIDGLTDVWAVGATMFSLLSGSLVHVGDNTQMLVVQAATQQARSLARVVGNVPAPVVAVIDRALAYDRAQRWPGAAAMRDAIARASLEAFGDRPSKTALATLVTEDDVAPATSEPARVVARTRDMTALPVSVGGLVAAAEAGRVDTAEIAASGRGSRNMGNASFGWRVDPPEAIASKTLAATVALSVPPARLSGAPPSVSHATAAPVVATPPYMPAPQRPMIGAATAKTISSYSGGEAIVTPPARSSSTRILVAAVTIVALLGIVGVVVAALQR